MGSQEEVEDCAPDTGLCCEGTRPSSQGVGNSFRCFFTPMGHDPPFSLGPDLGHITNWPLWPQSPHQDTKEVDSHPLSGPLNAALVSASLEHFGRITVENS